MKKHESGLPSTAECKLADDGAYTTASPYSLEEPEQVYRRLFENAPKGIFRTSRQGHYLDVNPALARIYGYDSPKELMAALTDIARQLYVKKGRREEFIHQLQNTDVVADFESEVYRKDGTVIWIAEHARGVKDEVGRVLFYEGFVDDITSRKRNELRLTVQYAVTRALSELPTLERAAPKVLQSICECLGWRMGTFWEMDYSSYMLRHFMTWHVPSPDVEAFAARNRDVTFVPGAGLPGRVWSHTKSLVVSNIAMEEDPRSLRAAAIGLDSAFLFPVARGGEIFGVIEFFNDKMTAPDHGLLQMMSSISSQIGRFIEVKRAEESLMLRDNAIQEMNQGVVITDPLRPDNPIVYCNPAFEKLTGYSREEVIGVNCRFLQGLDTDHAAVEKIRNAIRSAQPTLVEILNYRKDGTSFWNALTISPVFDSHGVVMRYVGVQTDITEIKQLQENFQRSQKMEAFGQLAGGIAHDFNNILSAVLGYSEIMLNDLDREDRHYKFVEQIFRAGQRAEGLTRQLLAFSRKQTLKPKILDLRVVVGDIQKMLRRIIGEHIELHTISSGVLGSVRADPGQIEQVILNLVVNARDAMPNGGVITIGTADVSYKHNQHRPASVTAGDYVALTVSDTGIGIPDDVKPRIFEPFFTTKEKGKGTGLGLATCYGIIQQSGGCITVESEPGRGTTFRVLLPRATEAVPADDSKPRLEDLPRGAETILVAEDDDAVREITVEILAGLGYTVLQAGNGLEAQTVVGETNDRKIDLLLADIVMPKMGGKEFADWLSAEHPGTKVLFTSGYIEDEIVRHDLFESSADFLQKPATPAALAVKVREVLGR